MAEREDPLRSLSAVMAAVTMAATGGWAAGALGFLGAAFLAGAAAASDMLRELFVQRKLMNECCIWFPPSFKQGARTSEEAATISVAESAQWLPGAKICVTSSISILLFAALSSADR